MSLTVAGGLRRKPTRRGITKMKTITRDERGQSPRHISLLPVSAADQPGPSELKDLSSNGALRDLRRDRRRSHQEGDGHEGAQMKESVLPRRRRILAVLGESDFGWMLCALPFQHDSSILWLEPMSSVYDTVSPLCDYCKKLETRRALPIVQRFKLHTSVYSSTSATA
jgi:hypothetical protein